jgi:AcrR family transcriptional regulator
MVQKVTHTDAGQEQPAAPAASSATPGSTTRERILDVALDLFVRKGYAETSLREIAEAMDFSKAAIYYHFASKQDILLALHLRLHQLTAGMLPRLQAGASTADTWEQLVDRLIGIALQNRRLIELNLRNQEAIAALHQHEQRANHGLQMPEQQDLQAYIFGLLSDPSLTIDQRVRRMASLGAVAGVLFTASAAVDLPDAVLETTLRGIIHELLQGHAALR